MNSEPSVLVDFDAGDVLDALSFGIIVLDEQLCTIYANDTAQDLLAVHLSSIRGRPLAHFLPQGRRFAGAVQHALRSGAAVYYNLRVGIEFGRGNADSVTLRVVPVRNRMSGAYVLVEVNSLQSKNAVNTTIAVLPVG